MFEYGLADDCVRAILVDRCGSFRGCACSLNNKALFVRALLGEGSLAVTYFRTGIRTIIGAEAFHSPVRDGKEWVHLAMAAKLKRFRGLKTKD